MRNVVIFTGTLRGGGAERVAVLLAHALVARGYDVTLLTLSDTDLDFYPIDPAIRRVGLNLMGSNSGLGKITATVARIRALRQALRDLKADTAIAFMTQESVLMILAGLGMTLRVVVSERSNPEKDPQPRLWQVLRRLCYRFADMHVVQTRKTAEWLCRNAKVRTAMVVPNPVTLPLPDNAPRLMPASYVPSEAKMLLAVGSVPYVKGFDLLVRAFVQAAPDLAGWHLVIVGVGDLHQQEDGSFAAALQEASAAGLGDRVQSVGRCGNLGDWYGAADMFVLSSRYEGMPNVLLEAMAHGVPSLAFDCPTGPSEIIRTGENGLLLPAEDVDALAKAMTRLANDATQRDRLGQQAQKVLQDNGLDRIMDMWCTALGERPVTITTTGDNARD